MRMRVLLQLPHSQLNHFVPSAKVIRPVLVAAASFPASLVLPWQVRCATRPAPPTHVENTCADGRARSSTQSVLARV